MDVPPVPSIAMAPYLRGYLKSAEVANRTDPNIRRLDRLIAVGLESKDYDLAVWAWLVSTLKARGNRHGLALQAALLDRGVEAHLIAASISRGEGWGAAGEGVAGG